MNDLELLELAANVAKIELPQEPPKWSAGWMHYREWNPLMYDSDALRLAVKCKMRIEIVNDVVIVDNISETLGTDPYKATRRAIVRAAAAIKENQND